MESSVASSSSPLHRRRNAKTPASPPQPLPPSTPPVLPVVEFEVFLSFRGPDTRNAFADYLYNSLTHSKIRTFRDDEELEKGEKIASSLDRAVPECKIYIPILSERYAASKWCLRELAQMVKCWKLGKGHLILPVFYFVDPRDVRKQQGPYQEAFEQHFKKHTPETVKEWKEALLEVGQLDGWHVTESEKEGAIVHEVLSKVESHLRSMYTLVIDVLVGIDERVEEVMELLDLGSSTERVMVGIHGMGGIGKTTLSKAVYNKISAQFDRCCVLENVRETLIEKDGDLCLVKKVMSTILKDDRHLNTVSEGINQINQRVSKHKVLILVDDIDDKFKFDKILGNLGAFSSDSRFIFTSRNVRELEVEGCKLYELGVMSDPHSLQLFRKHAFRRDNLQEEYVGITKKFVENAAGHPLSLEVMGSLVFRREMEFWEDTLQKYESIPHVTKHNKVQESLKISYNDLTKEEQQIFLDIACFFIGSHKDLPYYMWSGCEYHPLTGIKNLIERSLIKLDKENRFWMHDRLRDLGRTLVKEENVQDGPYDRSRIWSNDDAIDMLRKGKGSERVEVLRVDLKYRDDHERLLEGEKFKNLSGLRYLEVRGGIMTGDFSQVLPNLRCLRLPHCESIPTNVNTTKLAVLDLEECDVKDNWKGWKGIKAAAKLEVVNLPDCKKLTSAPDLYTCASLELINFEGCHRMEGQLHIDNFKNLKTLRLLRTHITGLIIRGNDIGKLQRLEEMDLRFTRVTALPAGMENLSSLKILLLDSGKYNRNHVEVPRLPVSLKRLTISSPSSFEVLVEILDLESCVNARNPRIPGDLLQFLPPEISHDFIWLLVYSKELTLVEFAVYCMHMEQKEATSPAALPPSLISQNHYPLNELPSLANLSNLTQLKLTHVGVVEIRGLGELRALETMWISEFPNLNNLDGLENLHLLTSLHVGFCGVLERLPSVANLIKLKVLAVYQCPVLVGIQGLGFHGESLSRLEVSSCPSLANLGGLQLLEALEDLTFEGQWCREKPSLNLSGLVNLKRVNILRCPGEIELTGLEKLVLLESLDMGGCASILQLPDLSGLMNLKTLVLTECNSLINLPTGIDRLESLRELKMQNCCSITKLPNLSGLKKLAKLDLTDCTELTEVKGVEGLESLKKLLMSGCRSVKKLGNVSGLKNLRELNIEGCTKLTKVDGLEELQDGSMRLHMGKRMRAKHLAKLAARYGKGIASRVVGLPPTGGSGGTTTSLRKLATEGRSLLGDGVAESLRRLKKLAKSLDV